MISHTLLVLAQAAPTAAPKPPDPGMNMLVMMGFAFVIIYILMIRPQQKKQKELAAQIGATKTGDKVITSSGIHGIIANVKEKTFILKVADNVKIEIEKSSIASVVKSSSKDAAADAPASANP